MAVLVNRERGGLSTLRILHPATSTHNHSVSDCFGDWSVTIPTACGQTWQGRDSCSGLTQLVKSWESLACLQLCSGSPVGWWCKPCSYRLAAQWRRSCFQWAPRCSAGVCWVVGRPMTHPTPNTSSTSSSGCFRNDRLVSISRNAATGRATWRHLSSSPCCYILIDIACCYILTV